MCQNYDWFVSYYVAQVDMTLQLYTYLYSVHLSYLKTLRATLAVYFCAVKAITNWLTGKKKPCQPQAQQLKACHAGDACL